ncbi:MAG: aspartate dehydrogenase [Lachnospiraceae bacterium]|nr:aspartate dehydrogenase [Lachnospiraceae bacterium]
MFFKKKKKIEKKTYDKETKLPVIKCSICNGQQVAGFEDKKTKKFEDIMFIITEKDLDEFKEMYDIEGEIKKIY